jgi:transposase
VNQVASAYSVHACQVSEWTKQLMELGTDLFWSRRRRKTAECSEDVDYLQQQIGKLTVELHGLKKPRITQ